MNLQSLGETNLYFSPDFWNTLYNNDFTEVMKK